MGAETLERWPDGPEPEAEAPAKKHSAGMLDTILEVMDLSQLDTAIRHAALADVVITPLFGPADWRDFHMADLFLAAGRGSARAAARAGIAEQAGGPGSCSSRDGAGRLCVRNFMPVAAGGSV